MNRDDRLAEAARAARDVVPILLGAVPFGVLFGALAAEADFGLLNTLLMSVLVNSGTMQMIGLNMISVGTGWPLIAFASFIVNSRHAFYSAALTPHVGRLSLWWRLVLSFGMTDQVYVLAERRFVTLDGRRGKHWYMLSVSCVLFAVWIASTGIGFGFGDVLKQFEQLGLDFALVATYIALAASSFGDFRAVAAGASAGLLAVSLFGIPYQGGLFIAVVGGIVVGLISDRLFPPQESDNSKKEVATSKEVEPGAGPGAQERIEG